MSRNAASRRLRVREVRVACVDDDVALVHERNERVDHRIGRVASLDHDDDLARLLERRDEVLEALATDERAFGAVLVDERLHLGCAAVVDRDRKSVPGEVSGQVAAHHGQSCYTYLGKRHVTSLSRGVSQQPRGCVYRTCQGRRVAYQPRRLRRPIGSKV